MKELSVSSIMNVIGQMISKDTSIAVADSKQFIYYHPSQRINLDIRPGDIIKEDTVTFKALFQEEKVSEYKDEDLFGIPYYGVSTPILDGGKPYACVTAILPREHFKLPMPFLTIRTIDRWLPVSFEEVIYLEAQNRKTKVESFHHRGDHKLNLSELEYMLPKEFIRCHRSYIINLNHIVEIHPDSHSTFMLIMKNGIRVPVSQTYASRFRQLLGF